jgi:hypothetical protein
MIFVFVSMDCSGSKLTGNGLDDRGSIPGADSGFSAYKHVQSFLCRECWGLLPTG